MADPVLQGVRLAPSQGVSAQAVRAAAPQEAQLPWYASLAKLNPMIQQLGQQSMEAKYDPQAKADAEAKIGLMSNGKSSSDLMSVDRTGFDAIQNRALDGRMAEAAAYEAAAEVSARIAEDPANADRNAIINEMQEKYKDRIGTTSTGMRIWNQAMGSIGATVDKAQTNALINDKLTQRDEAVKASFVGGFRSAMAANPGKPEAGLKAVREMAAQNKDFLKMPYDQQSKLLQGLVVSAAESGDVEMVKQLGQFDRGKGRIADIMGTVYQNAEQKAVATRDTKEREDLQPKLMDWQLAATEGQLTAEQVNEAKEINARNPKLIPNATIKSLLLTQKAALTQQENAISAQMRDTATDDYINHHGDALDHDIDNGSVFSSWTRDAEVELPNGKKVTVPAKDVAEKRLQQRADYLGEVEAKRVEKQLRASGADDDEIEAAKAEAKRVGMLKTYARNAKLPKEVEASATGVLFRSTADRELTDADRQGARDLINIVKHAGPLSGEVMKSDRDKAFGEILELNVGYGDDIDTAIKKAIVARDNFNATAKMPLQDHKDMTDLVMKSLAAESGPTLFGKLFGATGTYNKASSNTGAMQYLIEREIDNQYRNGTDASAIPERVIKNLKENTVPVNGRVVDLYGLKVTPDQASELFTNANEQFIASRSKLGEVVDGGEVSWIRQGKTDKFYPVYNGVPSSMVIDLSDMQLSLKSAKTIKSAAKAQEDLKIGLDHSGNVDEMRKSQRQMERLQDDPFAMQGKDLFGR
ncbi:hypothetical protein [Phyllobacterium endophyticum]|uniref:hypothetical protein n=1 Tax=Phyllobacterium endophyticum TaxID=1149773 RepID=UPI0011CB0E0C|nr:hypothetical protein [Phyllobacterium endophyticum]TXR49887.1 hypothetical protein FVA77_07695 [Phyllobacterium endophyticum]